MKSSVICIGDEILIGQIADTNSRFIAQRLNSLGIECSSIKIVADDKKALVELINEESKRSDLIILSGGLGPTNDDLTREAIAHFLSKKLIFSGSTIITGSTFDNGFISSPIPRSEFQYSWINASISGSNWEAGQRILGYAPRDGIVSSSATLCY